jgi:HPt (histidine-containing phosphotransfer) domain-containing protein
MNTTTEHETKKAVTGTAAKQTTGPVLDPAWLRQLADELKGREAAIRFALDYLDLLPGRGARILQALSDRDPAAALDAVLSLKVTSSMAGAVALEQLCRALELSLRNGRPGDAAALAASLPSHTEALAGQLADLLAEAAAGLWPAVSRRAAAA